MVNTCRIGINCSSSILEPGDLLKCWKDRDLNTPNTLSHLVKSPAERRCRHCLTSSSSSKQVAGLLQPRYENNPRPGKLRRDTLRCFSVPPRPSLPGRRREIFPQSSTACFLNLQQVFACPAQVGSPGCSLSAGCVLLARLTHPSPKLILYFTREVIKTC